MNHTSTKPRIVAALSAAMLTLGIIGGAIAPTADAAETISCSDGRSQTYSAVSSRTYPNNGLCLVKDAFKAVYQSDGNLVVYKNNSAIWSSQTANRGADRISLQADSNLVIYGGSGAIWSSQSGAGKRWNGTELRMQSDGNLVIYGEGDGTWIPLWSTGTAGS